MSVRLDQRIGGRFLDRGGAVLNVRHPDFGALGDGSTDDTAAIQAAIDTAAADGGGRVFIPAGNYAIRGTLVLNAPYGLIVEGAGGEVTRLIGTGKDSRVPAVQLLNRFSTVRDLGIHYAGYGLQLGSATAQGQACSIENVWFRQCGTGIRGTNGNTNKVWSCFFESCDTGLHITAATANGNGWTVYGTRAYGCAIGYWLEGNGDHRFADDNLFIGVTAEAYSRCGFRVSGIRNIIDLYTETDHSANPGAIDVWNESEATSNFFRYNTPAGGSRVRGVRNGIINGVSPIEFRERLVQVPTSVVDLVSDRSDQHFQEGELIEYRNTGQLRTVLLQALDTRRIGGSQYYYFPSSNVAPVRLTLHRPEGFRFIHDGSEVYTVAAGRARFLRLYRVGEREFALSDQTGGPGPGP